MADSRVCCAVAADGSSDCERCRLTERVLARRPTLLRLARRHSVSAADAEDAVQEAITRALERIGELDPARVEGWLATVTLNICRDMARDRGRRRQRLHYQYRQMIPEQYVDEDVAERAYAACVATRVRTLPDAQRTVLELRAAAMPIDEIATELGITAKSAESLLSRGRRAMRAIAVSLQAVVVCGWLRRRTGLRGVHTAGAYVGALTAAAVVVAATASTPGEHRFGVARTAAVPHAARAVPEQARRLAETPIVRSLVRRSRQSHATPIATPGATRTAPLQIHSGGVSRRKPNQSFVESVEACLAEGVTVSPSYIGCNAAG